MMMMSTSLLFNEINASRDLVQKNAIENSLLASKLGILVAIKTEKYASFKGEFVELTQHQLRALEHIAFEYFNANIEERLPQLIVDENDGVSAEQPMIQRAQKSFIQKISGFFGFRT